MSSDDANLYRDFILPRAPKLNERKLVSGIDISKKAGKMSKTTNALIVRRLLAPQKTLKRFLRLCDKKLATEFNVGKASAGDINEWMEEDGGTAEFLTDDDIAEAVTQEPMEEEGSDDETQCDKKEVVPHADGAAALALRYLEQQPDTTPADVLFMRRWRNYASSKRLSSLRQKKILYIFYI
ncbi:hypothetical protein TNCV_4799601 [Trichonephila clavipes]|uniref:Uncharacterized protein n=1 Tax=Trichonephila clavipes TaxID=2585209 RepID=A0A8X6V4Y9_TRICX|nr:hypothetical protein TNCV_4799601 [Trichonephila clavipes]